MIGKSSSLSLGAALFPVLVLILLLGFNVSVFGDNALGGSNQFILLIGAAVAAVIGFQKKVSYATMIEAISANLMATTSAILILLFVGALASTWLVSGIIPAMIYYGLQIIHPTIFFTSLCYNLRLNFFVNREQLDHFCNGGYCSNRNWKGFGASSGYGSRSRDFWCLFWR